MTLLDILLRIGISLGIGLLIGFEREASDKPAGVRTIALVTLGATLFTLIALRLVDIAEILSVASRYDFGRILAYLVVAVGFLGSGVIRMGKKSEGITTAAVLWCVVALGILAGLGEYLLVIIAGLIVYLILASKYIKIKISKRRKNAD